MILYSVDIEGRSARFATWYTANDDALARPILRI